MHVAARHLFRRAATATAATATAAAAAFALLPEPHTLRAFSTAASMAAPLKTKVCIIGSGPAGHTAAICTSAWRGVWGEGGRGGVRRRMYAGEEDRLWRRRNDT